MADNHPESDTLDVDPPGSNRQPNCQDPKARSHASLRAEPKMAVK